MYAAVVVALLAPVPALAGDYYGEGAYYGAGAYEDYDDYAPVVRKKIIVERPVVSNAVQGHLDPVKLLAGTAQFECDCRTDQERFGTMHRLRSRRADQFFPKALRVLESKVSRACRAFRLPDGVHRTAYLAEGASR